jgi:Zn-dependent metalloprotease
MNKFLENKKFQVTTKKHFVSLRVTSWLKKQKGGKMRFKVSMAILVCIFLHLTLQDALPAQEKYIETWQKFKNDFKSPGLKVVWDKTTSVPRIIMGTKVAPSLKSRQKINEKTIPAVIFDFLKKYQPLLRVPGRDIKVKSIKQFQNKWYVKAQTYYKGIPIFRSQVGFVLDQNGNILSFGSDCDPFIKVDTHPAITKREAVQIAHRHHKTGVELPIILKDVYLTIYQEILPQKPRKYRLAWYIHLGAEAGHWQVDRVFFLDALTGEKIKDFYPWSGLQV